VGAPRHPFLHDDYVSGSSEDEEDEAGAAEGAGGRRLLMEAWGFNPVLRDAADGDDADEGTGSDGSDGPVDDDEDDEDEEDDVGAHNVNTVVFMAPRAAPTATGRGRGQVPGQGQGVRNLHAVLTPHKARAATATAPTTTVHTDVVGSTAEHKPPGHTSHSHGHGTALRSDHNRDPLTTFAAREGLTLSHPDLSLSLAAAAGAATPGGGGALLGGGRGAAGARARPSLYAAPFDPCGHPTTSPLRSQYAAAPPGSLSPTRRAASHTPLSSTTMGAGTGGPRLSPDAWQVLFERRLKEIEAKHARAREEEAAAAANANANAAALAVVRTALTLDITRFC
jgi:hypothetical protein